eukprot:14691321-Alexandrium_andersonii.AAC.1
MTSGRDPAHGRHRNLKRRSIAACMSAHLVVSCIAHMLRLPSIHFCGHEFMQPWHDARRDWGARDSSQS